jgi:hypothetical protein
MIAPRQKQPRIATGNLFATVSCPHLAHFRLDSGMARMRLCRRLGFARLGRVGFVVKKIERRGCAAFSNAGLFAIRNGARA